MGRLGQMGDFWMPLPAELLEFKLSLNISMANVLRQEARPISWDDLDVVQQRAVTFILQLLAGAVEELVEPNGETSWSGSRRATQFALDTTRSNRLAFLSGDRGTGKTTVLLSARSMCELAHPGEPVGIGRRQLGMLWR